MPEYRIEIRIYDEANQETIHTQSFDFDTYSDDDVRNIRVARSAVEAVRIFDQKRKDYEVNNYPGGTDEPLPF